MKLNKGFTLIELLVVIAIIGLLSTLALISLNSSRQDARNAKRRADIANLQTALTMYHDDNGTYPTGTSCFPHPNCNDGICVTVGQSGYWLNGMDDYITPMPYDPGGHSNFNYNEYGFCLNYNNGPAHHDYVIDFMLEGSGVVQEDDCAVGPIFFGGVNWSTRCPD